MIERLIGYMCNSYSIFHVLHVPIEAMTMAYACCMDAGSLGVPEDVGEMVIDTGKWDSCCGNQYRVLCCQGPGAGLQLDVVSDYWWWHDMRSSVSIYLGACLREHVCMAARSQTRAAFSRSQNAHQPVATDLGKWVCPTVGLMLCWITS